MQAEWDVECKYYYYYYYTGLVFKYSRDEYGQIVLGSALDTESQPTRLVSLYAHLSHLQSVNQSIINF